MVRAGSPSLSRTTVRLACVVIGVVIVLTIAELTSERFKEFTGDHSLISTFMTEAVLLVGVYLVIDEEDQQPLYAGESLNLRVRLTRQFDKEPLRAFWKKPASELSVRYFTADADVSLLLAYQSLCVRKRRPTWNLIEPSLA